MYHVMNRGACRTPIFNSNNHKELFLTLLAEMVQIYKIEIHAYCLMDNHYHLLIRTPLANISKAMRYLNSVYTIKYNKLQKKDGALFRGRYKSMLIVFEVDISEVKKSRRGITNDARTMTMLIASKYFGYKLPVISEYFGLSSYQTVSKLYLSLHRKMDSDGGLKRLLSEILKYCKFNTPIAK